MKKTLAIILIASTHLSASGQSVHPTVKSRDSLIGLTKGAHDTVRVSALIELGRLYVLNGDGKFEQYLNKSIVLSRQIDYSQGLAVAYSTLGKYYTLNRGDYTTAKLYLDSATAQNVTRYQKREVNYAWGVWYTMRGEFDKSHEYLTEILKASGDKEDKLVGFTFDVMAHNLSKTGRKREAVKYYRNSIKILGRLRHEVPALIGARLNNLGVVYVEMDQYDSAFTIFRKLWDLEAKHGNVLNNPGLLSNMGMLYLKSGERDSAYFCLHAGLQSGTTGVFAYARSLCLKSLGRYHLESHLDSALYYGHALRQHNQERLLSDLESASYILFKAHEKRGRIDSAFYYQTQYLSYHDSLSSLKKAEQVAALEAEFELAIKEKAIQNLEKEKQQEKFKRNILLVGVCLLGVILILILLHYRLKMRSRQKEIELRNTQLENFARAMVDKSALVEELRDQLKYLNTETSFDKTRIEALSRILNASILTEKHWEEFKLLFEHVYPGFFATLKFRYPGLSPAEIRMSALVKLNLTAKEIGNILGISTESVNTAKYRLRKKMELLPDQDLFQVICSLA